MSTTSNNLNISDISFSYSTLEEIGVEEEEEKEVETIFNNPFKYYVRYAEEKHEYDNIYKQNRYKYYCKIIYGVVKMLITEKTLPLITDTLLRIPVFSIGLPLGDKILYTLFQWIRGDKYIQHVNRTKLMLIYKCIIFDFKI